MNCEQARPLVGPYADGELDAAKILELEEHLRNCAACALASRNLQSLRKAMKQDALYFTAPSGLKRRITAELRSQVKTRKEPNLFLWKWLIAGTSVAAIACLALLLTLANFRSSGQQQVAREIVSSHVRSLMANHALDVASTDQHTVKPWFDGKIDFAPPVKDLAPEGFPLIGGRLDYVDGHPVAALVFQRQQHVINLFIWPRKSADSNPAALTPIRGYNVVHWSHGDMTFWTVSDLNPSELKEFAETFKKK